LIRTELKRSKKGLNLATSSIPGGYSAGMWGFQGLGKYSFPKMYFTLKMDFHPHSYFQGTALHTGRLHGI
jgi:hypothetical protein